MSNYIMGLGVGFYCGCCFAMLVCRLARRGRRGVGDET